MVGGRMEQFQHLVVVMLLRFIYSQEPVAERGDVIPRVHQLLMLEPVPIEGMVGRDTLRLECNVSGNPTPEISWSFNGMKFEPGVAPRGVEGTPVRHKLEGNRLTIVNVKGKSEGDPNYYDSGRYRCFATNTVGSVFLEKNIQIRVIGKFKPGHRFNDHAKKWNPIVGHNYQIKCPPHTIGYGTEYRWGIIHRISGQAEFWLPGQKNRKLFYKQDGTLVWSVISFDDIKESRDIGGLRCILFNSGQFTASNQQVLWQPYDVGREFRRPILVTKLAPSVHVPVANEYRMTCGATGNPIPTYSWQYQGRDIVSLHNGSDETNFKDFEFRGHKMTLRIRRVSKHTAGTFRCFAKNELGIMWSIGQLYVDYPPKLVGKFPESIEIPWEKSLVLPCNVTGFPRPIIEWYHNSSRITTQGRRRIGSDDESGVDDSTLTITKVAYDDNGIYICIARNWLDTLTMHVNVKVMGMTPKIEDHSITPYQIL